MLNTKLRALDMKSKMRDAFAEPSYIATESPKVFGVGGGGGSTYDVLMQAQHTGKSSTGKSSTKVRKPCTLNCSCLRVSFYLGCGLKPRTRTIARRHLPPNPEIVPMPLKRRAWRLNPEPSGELHTVGCKSGP